MSAELELPGCRLAWQEAGGGPPVLFIHGTAAALWGELPSRVAAFARAITYDRRGFGRSPATPVASLKDHEDDAIALLSARASGGGAVLVGWSIGGVIALGIAARRPELVRGLVLLEPPLWAKKHPTPSLFNGVVVSILKGYLAGPAAGGRRFSAWVFGERDGGSSLDRIAPDQRQQIADNAAAIGVELRGGTGEHLAAGDVATITAPTIVLTGDRSRPFFEQSARRVAETIPGARLERLAGASHFLQLERPDAVISAIRGMVEHGAASAA